MGSDIDGSIYFYTPSLPACIVVLVLYFIPTILLTWQTCFRYRSWYFICVPIGASIEVAGYIVRAYSVKHVTNIPSYAVSVTLIVLAPLFVAAGNYLLIGRLMAAVLPPGSDKILGLGHQKITKIFVGFDILSFFIQGSGSGVASSNNWQGPSEVNGVHILIAGLATQLATILVFTVIVVLFSKRTLLESQVKSNAPEGWQKVLMAISVSVVLIAIRSLYRVIEFGLGINGYPFNHEWVFYVFESVPMLPAIAVFCTFHPAKYLPKKKYSDNEAVVEEHK